MWFKLTHDRRPPNVRRAENDPLHHINKSKQEFRTRIVLGKTLLDKHLADWHAKYKSQWGLKTASTTNLNSQSGSDKIIFVDKSLIPSGQARYDVAAKHIGMKAVTSNSSGKQSSLAGLLFRQARRSSTQTRYDVAPYILIMWRARCKKPREFRAVSAKPEERLR